MAIDGGLVSVFDLNWSHEKLWDAIGRQGHGFDKPIVSFGTLKIAAAQRMDGSREYAAANGSPPCSSSHGAACCNRESRRTDVE